MLRKITGLSSLENMHVSMSIECGELKAQTKVYDLKNQQQF